VLVYICRKVCRRWLTFRTARGGTTATLGHTLDRLRSFQRLDGAVQLDWADLAAVPNNGGVSNLVLLCERHHHAHHEAEFSITPLGHGRFRFLRHDGRVLPDHVDPADLGDIDIPIDTEHSDIPDNAATTRWTGEQLDHPWAIAVLADRRQRERERERAS